jgi:hypothetical protein
VHKARLRRPTTPTASLLGKEDEGLKQHNGHTNTVRENGDYSIITIYDELSSQLMLMDASAGSHLIPSQRRLSLFGYQTHHGSGTKTIISILMYSCINQFFSSILNAYQTNQYTAPINRVQMPRLAFWANLPEIYVRKYWS